MAAPWVSACLLISALFGAEPPKTAKRDLSHEFFATGSMPHIRIEIAEVNYAGLQKESRKYVRRTLLKKDSTRRS